MQALLTHLKSKLVRGEAEGGMEMIQVAFSIAIAVALGLIVFLVINFTVAPGMNNVQAGANNLFSDVGNIRVTGGSGK